MQERKEAQKAEEAGGKGDSRVKGEQENIGWTRKEGGERGSEKLEREEVGEEEE